MSTGALDARPEHGRQRPGPWPVPPPAGRSLGRAGRRRGPAPELPRRLSQALVAALVLGLAACSSGPSRRGSADGDGPEARPPAHLDSVPDALPRIEPLRPGGPNKPYEVLGRSYTPITADIPWRETGLASWYGRKFHGRPTSSGEVYDMYAMTAAHKTLPLPSYARIRNPANGREVIVRINDRGPFHSDRIVDLSYTAALRLGVLGGVAPVELVRITHDEIRAGVWRRDRTMATPPALTIELPALAQAPAPAPERTVDDPLLAWLAQRDAGIEAAAGSGAGNSTPAAGFWLQLGAFRQRDAAERLRERLARDAAWLLPSLFDDRADERSDVHTTDRSTDRTTDRVTVRVQAGPYASRAEAAGIAARLRAALALEAVIVERR